MCADLYPDQSVAITSHTGPSPSHGLVDEYSRALLGALVIVGDQLGLFATLCRSGPLTPIDLARTTGCSHRYLNDWMATMACGGYLVYHSETGSFGLLPQFASHLDPDGGLGVVSGLYALLPSLYRNVPLVAQAYGRGVGISPDFFGEEFETAYDRFTRPVFKRHMVQGWLPSSVARSLTAGARVADAGCGAGGALLVLADAYPAADCTGYDVSPTAIQAATLEAEMLGIADRVRFGCRDVVQGLDGRFSLILAFNIAQSLPHLTAAFTALRDATDPDGVVLWGELAVSDELSSDAERQSSIAATSYALSALYGITTSLAQGGQGLSIRLDSAAAESIAGDAGFSHFRVLPYHEFFNVFELRP